MSEQENKSIKEKYEKEIARIKELSPEQAKQEFLDAHTKAYESVQEHLN